jgi:BirA family biotin operon repressor/biotin-[acetyl-CoA-carboxylase] ligase
MTVTVSVPAGRPGGQLAFVAVLGAGDAVHAVLPTGSLLTYKWPNDLMLDDAKLGGILIEGAAGLFAVGIGINMANAPADTGAAGLAQAGADVPVKTLLASSCREFDRWYRVWTDDGFGPLRRAWLGHAHRLQGPIEARFPDGSRTTGIFRDIDQQGALVLECENGTIRTIAAGEVFFATA